MGRHKIVPRIYPDTLDQPQDAAVPQPVRLIAGKGTEAEVGTAISMSVLAAMLCIAALGGL